MQKSEGNQMQGPVLTFLTPLTSSLETNARMRAAQTNPKTIFCSPFTSSSGSSRGKNLHFSHASCCPKKLRCKILGDCDVIDILILQGL